MTKQYKLKGINGDSDTCELCGKTNLKKVMWLAELDPDGNELGFVFAVGTTCGAKKLGLSTESKAISGQAISNLAYEMVETEIKRILEKECVNYRLQGTCILKGGYGRKIATGEMTLAEAVTKRNEAYPILEYNTGQMNIEEAIKYI
jgi:hypothetical protein